MLQVLFKEVGNRLVLTTNDYPSSSYYFNPSVGSRGLVEAHFYKGIHEFPWYALDMYHKYLLTTKREPIENPVMILLDAVDDATFCFMGSSKEEIIERVNKASGTYDDINLIQQLPYVFLV